MMKIMTIGTFDCFHQGHENLLKSLHNLNPEAKLIVGVNSNTFVKAYKREPKDDQLIRCLKVKNWLGLNNIAHEVFINIGFEAQPHHILDYQPNVFGVGVDWSDSIIYGEQLYLPTGAEEWFKENHIQLIYLPRLQGISTTQIIEGNNK